MSKTSKKSVKEELLEVDETMEEVPVPTPVQAPVAPLAAPARLRVTYVSFEQWAKRKNIPNRHLAGMKVFVSNTSQQLTMGEWDSIFAKY